MMVTQSFWSFGIFLAINTINKSRKSGLFSCFLFCLYPTFLRKKIIFFISHSKCFLSCAVYALIYKHVNLKYRRPSLYVVFLSAISRVCDPEMAFVLEPILSFTVFLGLFFMQICYMPTYFGSSYLLHMVKSTCTFIGW